MWGGIVFTTTLLSVQIEEVGSKTHESPWSPEFTPLGNDQYEQAGLKNETLGQNIK